MPQLLELLRKAVPAVRFESGNAFCWSPEHQTITYTSASLEENSGQWSLLHEAAHSVLGHATYQNDFELLMMEVAAWKQAVALGAQFGVDIDEEHVQDCLDTYRDWLHRRSTCPTCGSVSLQRTSRQYACHNCPTTWHVTAARFCRPYRKKLESFKVESGKSDNSVLHPTFQ